MIQRFFAVVYFGTLLFIGACSSSEQVGDEGRGLIAENAMVVSAREEASNIGLSMMQQGGNAFDAMVATELALAVAYPFAGNLGGGGFMVYRLADRCGCQCHCSRQANAQYHDTYNCRKKWRIAYGPRNTRRFYNHYLCFANDSQCCRI